MIVRSPHPPLDIAIIGAGISGLASALSLRRAGHSVTIYERSSLNNELGAAINICPNAARALLAWGFDPSRARFVTTKGICRIDAYSLREMEAHSTEKVGEKFGAPWYLGHRVDLHNELKRVVLEDDDDDVDDDNDQMGKGMKVKVEKGCAVVSYDPDTPSITLADGRIITADLIVAADGIHSTAVEAVLGRTNPAQPQAGHNFCYRFLVSRSEIEADEDARSLFENDGMNFRVCLGNGKKIVTYPCRNNEIDNFVGIFHNEISSMNKEDWQASVDKADVLDTFSDFHPSILAIIEKATEFKQWPLLYRPPIPTWFKGNLVLTGDAAHPMLPHQGQGGAQAIEDGIALGICLLNARREDIPQRLAVYESVRKNRASVMQIFSNAGQEESRLIEEEAAKYIGRENVPKSPEAFYDYNFGYDIVRDSVLKMKELDSGFEIPDAFFQRELKRGVYP